jgi:hypothetical protein
MPDQSHRKSWRRWLRVTVRGLIVLVLVMGAGLGWWVRNVRIQREAVAAIERAGGWVQYDWGWTGNETLQNLAPWAPHWLWDTLGADYVARASHVSFSDRVSDKELVHVGRLPELVFLYLTSENISDAGLVHLKDLTKLSELDLYYAQVTDSGLAHLKGMTKLSTLTLCSSRITDAGLVHLKELTNLSELDLRATQVTDAGLAHLKTLTKLSKLQVGDTQVTDAGKTQLEQALPNLKIDR